MNLAARMKNKVERARQTRKIQGRDQYPSHIVSKGTGLQRLVLPPSKSAPKSAIHDIPVTQDAQEGQHLGVITQRLPILLHSPPISAPPRPSFQNNLHGAVGCRSSDSASSALFKPESATDILLAQTRLLQVPTAASALSALSLASQPLQSVADQVIPPKTERLAVTTQSGYTHQSDPPPIEPSCPNSSNLPQQQLHQAIPSTVTPLPTHDQPSFIPLSTVSQDIATYIPYSADDTISYTTRREPQAFSAHTNMSLVNTGSHPDQLSSFPSHTRVCDYSVLEPTSLFSQPVVSSDINSYGKLPGVNTRVEIWDGRSSSRDTETTGVPPVKDVAIADGNLACDQFSYASGGGATGFSSLALSNDGLALTSEDRNGLSQFRTTSDGLPKAVPAWYDLTPDGCDHPYIASTTMDILAQGIHLRGLKRKARTPSQVDGEYKMYTPPGNIQAAMDGWWNWILEHYDKDKNTARELVTNACNSL